MTREEAKSFLQYRIELIDKDYPEIKDYREALDMAIKALVEIDIMAEALMVVADYECCDYGREEAFDIAERITKEKEGENNGNSKK